MKRCPNVSGYGRAVHVGAHSTAQERKRIPPGGKSMRTLLAFGALAVGTALALPVTPSIANDGLLQLQKKPEAWPMQLGNYAGQRYSTLDQINKDNVKNLRVAWSFSTGVLRGHEGGPLVVGDTMYV